MAQKRAQVLPDVEFISLVEQLPVLCWMARADGHVFWYNQRWYDYTGTSLDTQAGWGWQSVHEPQTLPAVVEKWRQSISTGLPFEMTFPLRGADGEFRPFLTRAVPKFGADGGVDRWYGTNVDVSAQMKAESDLRASESRFRTFAEVMPNHVWTALPSGHLNWFNTRVYEYSGVREGELDGDSWAQIVHPGDVPLASQSWRTALVTGKFYETKFRLRRHDGVYCWFIARATPILDSEDAIVQWIGTNTDINDQEMAARALYESERRLVLSQKAAGIASLELDIATGTVIGSDGFWKLWGLSARDSVPIAVLEDLVVSDDRAIRSNPETRSSGSAVPEVEYRIRRADTGELRWLWRSIDFEYDPAGRPQKMYGVMQDITERKTTEASLRDSEARYKSALSVGRLVSWETNFATGQRYWSPEGEALFGFKLVNGVGHIGGPQDEFRAALHPDDRHLVDVFHDLAKEHDSFPAEYRIVRSDGATLWLSGRGQVVSRDKSGNCERMLNVVADITERKRAEDHIRFLMRESSHRAKNLLTVIQAIAGQTVRTSGSLVDFQGKFANRLQGLAASHDLLIELDWKGVALLDLVRRHLNPFTDRLEAQVEITGPPVDLDANMAQAIGLALHELATNAVKYGALSTATGRVAVKWSIVESLPEPPFLTITWQEEGGPPVVAPSRKGFGMQVIATIAPVSVSGTATIDFDRSGVRWRLTMPLLQGAKAISR